MTYRRRKRITPATRRALRLAAWGHSAAGHGYADGMAVLPPQPPAEQDAARQYHAAYQLGIEYRRGQRAAAEGVTG